MLELTWLMASHNNGWWGEGEIKFFMDGDTELSNYKRYRY